MTDGSFTEQEKQEKRSQRSTSPVFLSFTWRWIQIRKTK